MVFTILCIISVFSDHFRGDAKNVETPLQVLMLHLSDQWISYRVHSINPNSSHLIHALGRFAALEIFPKLVEKVFYFIIYPAKCLYPGA